MPSQKFLETVQKRLDEVRVSIQNPQNVPITLFARKEIPIEMDAIQELLNFVSLADTLSEIWKQESKGQISPFWGENPGELSRIVLTPDFHKGSGIPVGTVAETSGFVLPKAVGNDICCGMRLLLTDIRQEEISPVKKELCQTLRTIFFEGTRDIPMSPIQREAMLRNGLRGLYDTHKENQNEGLWRYYQADIQEKELQKVHFQGTLPTKHTFSFDDYIKASGKKNARDSQIGSVGGGNHFVEIQTIEKICDGTTAHAWNLSKNFITIMAHSGSVGLGHHVGGYFHQRAKDLYPASMSRPTHGFYFFPTKGPLANEASAYLDSMRNAANFAFANRLFLGLMAIRALSEVLQREVKTTLLYDAPHNLIWKTGENTYLHRKGACPALGADAKKENFFRYTGHPVIIPGSMGDASYILAGEGNEAACFSACHGAGRVLSRGAASHVEEKIYTEAMEALCVVSPIDPMSPMIRSRKEILQKYHRRLQEEAPYAYKPITPVVQTVEDANIARRVARLWPLITVKG